MEDKEIRRLTYDETNSISGGNVKTIVKVSQNDLDKENLGFKPYLVIYYNNKIIGNYDTFEEASSEIIGEYYGSDVPTVDMQILKEGKLSDHLLQSANGKDYYLVLDWHQEV